MNMFPAVSSVNSGNQSLGYSVLDSKINLSNFSSCGDYFSNLGFGEFCIRGLRTFAFWLSAFFDHVFDVVLSGSQVKMVNIATRWVITRMQYPHSMRYWTINQGPHETVGGPPKPETHNLAVASDARWPRTPPLPFNAFSFLGLSAVIKDQFHGPSDALHVPIITQSEW